MIAGLGYEVLVICLLVLAVFFYQLRITFGLLKHVRIGTPFWLRASLVASCFAVGVIYLLLAIELSR